MVLPTAVIEHLIKLNKTWKKTRSILSDAVEGSEDSNSQDLPAIIIYSDFDETAELDSKKAYPTKLPCSIYAMFFSESFESVQDSFNKAFLMAVTFLKLVSENCDFAVNNSEEYPENVHLRLQDIPIQIIKKSASGSVVQLSFTYDIGL